MHLVCMDRWCSVIVPKAPIHLILDHFCFAYLLLVMRFSGLFPNTLLFPQQSSPAPAIYKEKIS